MVFEKHKIFFLARQQESTVKTTTQSDVSRAEGECEGRGVGRETVPGQVQAAVGARPGAGGDTCGGRAQRKLRKCEGEVLNYDRYININWRI